MMRCGEKNHVLSPEVRVRAVRDTRRGHRVALTPLEIVEQLVQADKALNGDSNDAEHDALFGLREWLSEVFENPKRRVGPR